MHQLLIVVLPHLLSDIVAVFICSPSLCCICRAISKHSKLISKLYGEISLCELWVKKVIWIILTNKIMDRAQRNRKSGLDVHTVLKGKLENTELAL